MALNTYFFDDGVVFTGTFTRTDNGAPFDPPGGVFARVRNNTLTKEYMNGVDPEFTHPSTGVYVLTILLRIAGPWYCHMWGEGIAPNPAIGAAAADDRIAVRTPAA